MMMNNHPLPVNKQLELLLEHGRDADGQRYRLADIAKRTDIRYQTLSNLINGSSGNPRLETLRALCRLYDISLDYFSCETEESCLQILKQHIVDHSHNLQEISDETRSLSPKGKRNVMTIIEWMSRATQGN